LVEAFFHEVASEQSSLILRFITGKPSAFFVDATLIQGCLHGPRHVHQYTLEGLIDEVTYERSSHL